MDILRSKDTSITDKYRALYKVKETEGDEARAGLVECLDCLDSVLLLHEACFALGQRGDAASIEALTRVLQDTSRDEVTRHESGEALGAIGAAACLPALDALRDSADEGAPVRETCDLAAARIRLLAAAPQEFATKSDFTSVDPTPSFVDNRPPACPEGAAEAEVVAALCALLCDEGAPLFDRYRAMFSLRNIRSAAAVAALCRGLVEDKSSALFRHEVAYVLGQLEVSASGDALLESLSREAEHGMVRHESAEALGSFATEPILEKLRSYCAHKDPLVSESCEVALDMHAYWAAWQPAAETTEEATA